MKQISAAQLRDHSCLENTWLSDSTQEESATNHNKNIGPDRRASPNDSTGVRIYANDKDEDSCWEMKNQLSCSGRREENQT